MRRFSLCIQGAGLPIIRTLRSNSLNGALRTPFKILLQIDGIEQTINIGGNCLTSVRTGWGNGCDARTMRAYLEQYRLNPADCRPDNRIRSALHHFLFAGNSLDALFPDDGSAPILIQADKWATRLLTNVPWELTDRIPHLQPGQAPEDNVARATLSSIPLARQLDCPAYELDVRKPERMHLIYCISQPKDTSPILADRFSDLIHDALQARTGMLDSTPVVGRDFSPAFQELLAQIDKRPPHVLIVICHGTTRDGTPLLRFDNWEPASRLAAKLAEHRKTLLTVVIACDQSFLDDGPVAHSGAMTLVQHGVPFVVAMQGSVAATLAVSFMGTTIDQLFQTGDIFTSVAGGRMSMAPTATATRSCVDWSFPGLFVCKDAPTKAATFFDLIERYIPVLEAMLRAIPVDPHPYLERKQAEEWLAYHLRERTYGIIAVCGTAGAGTSSVVRHVCRAEIAAAIRVRDTRIRPVLVVDLDRLTETIGTPYELAEVLRLQTEDAQPQGVSAAIVTWPQYRSADGTLLMANVWKHVIEVLDNNQMVLVIDHASRLRRDVRTELIKRSQTLLHSLVVLVDSAPSELDPQCVLHVTSLSPGETTSYAELVNRDVDAGEWYSRTGGNLRLLDALRRSALRESGSGQLSASDVREYTRLMTDGLPVEDIDILAALVHFPGGVDSAAAWDFVAEWPRVLELASRLSLVQEHRFQMSGPWVRLPGALTQGLRECYADAVDEAAGRLVNRFQENTAPTQRASRAERMIGLANRPGGLGVLHQIHVVLLAQGETCTAEAVAAYLHEWLFARSQWGDAFAFWERLLEKTPSEEVEPFCFLKAAKCAHVLGMGERAHQYLDRAKGLDRLEAVDAMNLNAALLKDKGYTKERLAEIHRILERALQALGGLEAEMSSDAVGDWQLSDIVMRRALIIYNRSLIYAHWEGRVPEAIEELRKSAILFRECGDNRMASLAECECVDVTLTSTDRGTNWEEMLHRLVEADAVFRGLDAWGDAAFCNYQLARYYRRFPTADPAQREINVRNALAAYEDSAKYAGKAGDIRQQQIAKGHIVEVKWAILEEMTDSEAIATLEEAIRFLGTFPGDAWSARVRRDMLFLRATVIGKTDSDKYLDELELAWNAAMQSPHHPEYGTDARRAARILADLLAGLESRGETLRITRLLVRGRNLLFAWLKEEVNMRDFAGELAKLRQFARGPGEYHG